MITQAKFETILSFAKMYRSAIIMPGAKYLRLFVSMLDTIGSFTNLPADVAEQLENNVVAIYNAARLGQPVPPVSCPVIYGVEDNRIVVISTRTTFADHVFQVA